MSAPTLLSARHSFSGPRSLDGWWDWSLTTMLEGLYWGGLSTASMLGAQPRALGGKHHLLGHLVIKQLKGTPDSLCELEPGDHEGGLREQRALCQDSVCAHVQPGLETPRCKADFEIAFSELVEDSFPTCGPKDGGPETPSVIDPEIQRVAPGGPRGSQEESSAWAAQALTGPRASGWIDHSTRAVSVHFTLYNPPTQLFSSVSLSAEMLPTGGLTLSSLLESVTIFCSDSAPLFQSWILAQAAIMKYCTLGDLNGKH
ncbi:polycystic kidney disease protein 1-like 1 [Neophocaena asiaeorientalis asiaeorientalis]|uniref:Polycystic kidney disease protein 1-like 1 n=1 Tax=Neophocaena asiaeorientalis asiaeorientalis TaxID=1706337 RepID=A0A341BJA4_NEOAA|nr:polycystic kidney disease protein 1-like 1 [Neophocaena asiaeorientalis asiaeorientalis]